ncbi:MAG: TetR/AcrR family transcriptional regulator [Pseudomonadota bacterium]
MSELAYFGPLPEEDPAQKRGRKKRATSHRIFTCAIELMQKEGFHSVTVEQICERAGIARATFFQHFGSKAALMGVFTDIVRQRIGDELASTDLAPVEQLKRIADHLQRLADELGAVASDMLAAFASEPGVRFRVDDPTTGITQVVAGIIEEGQAQGAFSDRWNPQYAAISLMAAWVAVSRHRVANPHASRGSALHDVLDQHLFGLARVRV